ncbi:MAG: hypothetical protein WC655_27445 [Candidatus Hydrogenedentales bacterium]
MTSWKRIAFALVMSVAVLGLMFGASACGEKKTDTPTQESGEEAPALDPQAQAIQNQMQQAPSSDVPANESPREKRERRRDR